MRQSEQGQTSKYRTIYELKTLDTGKIERQRHREP